jgi:hypothetical protein
VTWWASSSPTSSRHGICAFPAAEFRRDPYPQWAARAEYSTGDSHVELVWVPVQAFDNISKPGSDFYRRRCRRQPRQRGGVAEPGSALEFTRQLGLRLPGEHAGRRLGHRGFLLPQLQQFADVLSRTHRRGVATADLSAAVRPDLAGGGDLQQGLRQHGAARGGRLRERAELRDFGSSRHGRRGGAIDGRLDREPGRPFSEIEGGPTSRHSSASTSTAEATQSR